MGAPETGMQAAEQPAAETLLTALKTINAAERRKHASVLNYWLSIRGNKEFPPLHDFDPLEVSDFGQSSMLAELIGSGHDADIRHLGEALKAEGAYERIIDAPNPSILSSIARKLPIVTISRDFLAFEDSFASANGWTRCWVTLMPLSSSGAWVDYVYAFVSLETTTAKSAEASEAAQDDVLADEVVADEVVADEIEAAADEIAVEAEQPDEMPDEAGEPVEALQIIDEDEQAEPAEAVAGSSVPGFAKLFEGFAGLAGFYGQGVKPLSIVDYEPAAGDPQAIEPIADEAPAVEPLPVEQAAVEPEAVGPEAFEQSADEPEAVEESASRPAQLSAQPQEGSLQDKLAETRAKADEARAAKLRANLALYEGLGAAYDFALDAEDSPEEYLRLVEAQGLKIQLRSPMAPVVKLAFGGLCDEGVIAELEGVLAWALKQELPRGSLAARIDEAGGIAGILGGESRPS